MKVGIISVYVDYHRKGAHHRGLLQPQIGPLIAALLPPHVSVELTNDTWDDPDWTQSYDLLFISSLHSDFDRARQISHYWRRRGAKTVYGGIMASTYPGLCQSFFDAVVVGDPEGSIPQICEDFRRGELKRIYVSPAYVPTHTPVPRFNLIPERQVIPLSLEATRGCPFACGFCALTSVGTRHHTRPVEMIVRDIQEGQRMLRGLVPSYKRRWIMFNDNNIGGNLSYLTELCEALAPLNIRWGSCITFNVLTKLEMVKILSRSGCRLLFVGLESFNQDALIAMHKYQNAIGETRRVMDQCREHGILIVSGLMLNPTTDDCAYLRAIPTHLRECGLHVPSFICFESPIPGTPIFRKLAAEENGAFLPNALLRDFNGYTLVTKPKRETVEDFIDSYRGLMKAVYSRRMRFRKLSDDIARFLANGYWLPALFDMWDQGCNVWRPHPDRTFVAGTDVAPPEVGTVPLRESDFETEEEYRAVMEPWKVTDAVGRVLPEWLSGIKVYDPKGRISRNARALTDIGFSSAGATSPRRRDS